MAESAVTALAHAPMAQELVPGRCPWPVLGERRVALLRRSESRGSLSLVSDGATSRVALQYRKLIVGGQGEAGSGGRRWALLADPHSTPSSCYVTGIVRLHVAGSDWGMWQGRCSGDEKVSQASDVDWNGSRKLQRGNPWRFEVTPAARFTLGGQEGRLATLEEGGKERRKDRREEGGGKEWGYLFFHGTPAQERRASYKNPPAPPYLPPGWSGQVRVRPPRTGLFGERF